MLRSWTNNITNPLFKENLTYTLNGNIATQGWTQAAKTRSYTFAYDNLSRLKSAAYTGDGNFTENCTYDKVGNILTLTRYGITKEGENDKIIDNLTFGYTGNQLKFVNDAVPEISLSTSADFKDNSKVTTAEYTFNANGAMFKDLNKGIQGILYNQMNLPREMVISHTTVQAKNYYTYTANGIKVQVIHKSDPKLTGQPVLGSIASDANLTDTHRNDYVGNKIYEDGILKMILTDNGYYDNLKNTYYFYIKDHLGNNRIVADASGISIQSNQYYPFGMAFAEGTKDEQGKQPYKYNGKELDKEHGLNWYDYSARYFSPDVPRFSTMDPHGENYYAWSPYAYCANNPMRVIDPDGKDWKDFVNGVLNGGKQRAEAYANIVAHPIETVVNKATSKAPSIGEAVVNAVDNLSMGSISTTVNAVQAVATDLKGGNGSATGQIIGSVAVDAGVAVATGKTGEAIGKGIQALPAAAEKIGASLTRMGDVVKNATGGTKQWVRIGSSYSHNLGSSTRLSIRWGASPRYANRIGNSTLRSLNQELRGLKLPGNNWRVNDPGHFHIKR